MGTIVTRKIANGEIRYRAQVRIQLAGKKVRQESATFSKKSLAQEWLRRREAEIQRQVASGLSPGKRMTIGEVLAQYKQEVGAAFGRSKNHDLDRIAGYKLAELDAGALAAADLVTHIRWRRDQGVTSATANLDLIWLRTALKYAKRAWGLDVNPMVITEASEVLWAARVIGKPNKRHRRPTAEELRALDAWFQKKDQGRPLQLRLMMWFAIYSGRRLDEICRIRRQDLHAESGTYEVRDLKHPDGSAGNHGVALLPEKGWEVVRIALEQIDPDPDGRLFPYNSKSVSTRFANDCKLVGIHDLRFHDFRHEALSRLAEDGLTIPQIQQVSLHRDWKSLQIYVNLHGRRQERFDFVVDP